MMKVVQREFDDWIYPVRVLLTTDGVQYDTVVTNETVSYVTLFSLNTDTYYPHSVGELIKVYANLSFEILGGSNTPIMTYKAEAKNKALTTWTIMSAEETYQTTTGYIGKRLEGYLKITADAIDKAPFSLRVQFKSDGTGATNRVSVRLKNDTVIKVVGVYKPV